MSSLEGVLALPLVLMLQCPFSLRRPQRIIYDRIVAAGRPEWLKAQQTAPDRDTHDLWINLDGISVDVTDELKTDGEVADSCLTITFNKIEGVVASFNGELRSSLRGSSSI